MVIGCNYVEKLHGRPIIFEIESTGFEMQSIKPILELSFRPLLYASRYLVRTNTFDGDLFNFILKTISRSDKLLTIESGLEL